MSDMSEWIDLLEGELDEAELDAMRLMLRQSPEDRREFLRLSHLRDAIGEADPAQRWREKLESDAYQKKITDRVMKAIRSEKEIPLKIARDSSSS